MNRNLIVAGGALLALYMLNRQNGAASASAPASGGLGWGGGGGGGGGGVSANATAAASTPSTKKPVMDTPGPVPVTVYNETGGEFEYPAESGRPGPVGVVGKQGLVLK